MKFGNSILFALSAKRLGLWRKLSLGRLLVLLVLLSAGLFVRAGFAQDLPAVLQQNGAAAYYNSGAIALLLHQTPNKAGTITPDAGVHHFAPNSQVSLTAVPQPGYEFVSWLGEVRNPNMNTTTVILDKPKIIVAVFEPINGAFIAPLEKNLPAGGGGGGGGGMVPAMSDYRRQGWTGSGGGYRPDKIPLPGPKPVDPTVPEPATLLLLGLGSAILLNRRTPYGERR